MRRRLPLVVGLVLIAIPASLFAQARLTGADLEGIISDQTGGILAGSTITVTNVATNVTRSVVTDAVGRYTVPALPPGTYTISATLAGFRTQTREGVDLPLGQVVKVDFSLLVATASETVIVAAEPPPLSPSRTEISSVITQQQIEGLPINGRDFIGFALITPGVSTDRTPQQGAMATSGVSFTGQRGRSNNIMVDGLDNNDPFNGAVRATLSQEAVREFQVLVDSYSAEFGKASGGVVNIVTKSGTNAPHGNAFAYFRHDKLNAKKYFETHDLLGQSLALDEPPFEQWQWGATLGGPVRKNKTFFFASFEHTDVTDSRFVTIASDAAEVLNRAGFPVEVGNVPANSTNTPVFGKLDHQWTTTRALTVRGSYADVNREGIDEFGGIVARSRGTVQLRTDWALSVAETDVLSDRWINEFRAQYAHEEQQVNALDPLCGGPCTDVDLGGPTLEVTGVATVGRMRLSPQIRLIHRVQFADTVSYLRGAHQFKIGADYNFLTAPSHGNVLPANFGGRYVFSPIPALGVTSALDGLRKGIPAVYIQGYGNPLFPDERYSDLSLFAQDEWKHGRFVLKPGVRYQRQYWEARIFRASDVGGRTISFPLPSDVNNVAPRLGATLDVTADGRTIARGSYGMFYDNIVMAAQNVGRVLNGTAEGVRTLALPAPLASIAWNAPGHHLSEVEASALLGGTYASAVALPDPRLKNPFTHQTSVGVDRALTSSLTLSVNALYVRGFNQTGTLEYNPLLPARLGPGRRPNDRPCATNPNAACVNGGIPGTSATVTQYTSFGETWYKGLTVALNQRFGGNQQLLASYTLSRAEDTSTDFQASFIAQNSGYGRNPADPLGPPLGFDPRSERGGASRDQRHRLVVSGVYQLPWNVQLSGIATAASGRPFTPLAGADLNGDGNGGQYPPDRARRDPRDEATSVARNSETTAAQVSVDMRVSRRFRIARATLEALVEVFNLFNRANFIEDTNQSSFVIFGSGAYPSEPLPAYGKYTLTLPPRQVQLAAKISF